MGKKRIKTVDLSQKEAKKEKSIFKEKKAIKAGKGEGRLADMGTAALKEAEALAKKKKEEEAELKKITRAESKRKTKAKKKIKTHSQRYLALKAKVDRQKLYPFQEAVDLLVSLANSKIDETVELHFSTQVNKLTGSVKLPHGTGKKQKVAIADDELIDKINNGKIDFDILIATPKMMPKLAKVAKILGPKGLMPNPKVGTITDHPQDLKKKLEGGELRFKTEPKAPLIHLVIGKISFGKEKILENLQAVLGAIKKTNIKKATLTSTYSPGIKLELTNI